jgi:hypothetical protein
VTREESGDLMYYARIGGQWGYLGWWRYCRGDHGRQSLTLVSLEFLCVCIEFDVNPLQRMSLSGSAAEVRFGLVLGGVLSIYEVHAGSRQEGNTKSRAWSQV